MFGLATRVSENSSIQTKICPEKVETSWAAELGQAQVKLDYIVVVLVEVVVKPMVKVEVLLLVRVGWWVVG